MKAISIKEPWAKYTLKGMKTIETRTWSTRYRGELLLCASKNPVSNISGYAFAVCNLVDIVPMIPEHETRAMCNIYPNAMSWFLEDVEPIVPFKVKGQLGLFEVEHIIEYKEIRKK